MSSKKQPFVLDEDFEDEADENNDENEMQKKAMREWFYENYEDPANCTPYESAEGGYLYIWGGPFEANDVLFGQFGKQYPDEVIEELAEELTEECWEWAPTLRSVEYDEEMFDDFSKDSRYHDRLKQSIEQISSLLVADIDPIHRNLVNKLLYVNIITALESFLSEAFMYTLSLKHEYLVKFVENSKAYSSEKICLAAIFNELEKIEERVKTDLVNMVWHRLDKVGPYYSCTFGITFNKHLLPRLFQAIEKRHDIIHRNGMSKDQVQIAILQDDITDLTNLVAQFAEEITSQIGLLT